MTVEFFEKYRYKLKTSNELLDLVGALPRQKKTILCHGVFDVVHPGHVSIEVFAGNASTLKPIPLFLSIP